MQLSASKTLRILPLLAALLTAGSSQAQAANDHLVPPASSLTEPTYATRYHALLRERLALDSASPARVLIVVRPSFTPEYALWVEQRGPSARLVYRVAQRSIWGSQEQPQPGGPVSTRRVVLSPALAQALADVLNAALAQARYPVGRSLRGDGTTYLFVTSSPNLGSRAGEAWSPVPATRLGALVQLTEGLRELFTTSDHPDLRQDVLLTEAQKLLLRLAAR